MVLINTNSESPTECGRNAKVFLFSSGFSSGDVLRPEAATPPTVTLEVGRIRPARAIPEELQPTRSPEREIPDTALAIGGVNADKNAWPWMVCIWS